MPKRPKWFTEMKLVLPPLREYWRAVNKQQAAEEAAVRSRRKELDAKRPRCRCEAYKFPHRPGGGLCLWPNPPAATWKEREAAKVDQLVQNYVTNHGVPNTMSMDELRALMAKQSRPYRKRYAGLRRQIARASGLHPIRDRDKIDALMPRALSLAKKLHKLKPAFKYSFMEVTETGVRGHRNTAGPVA